MQDCITPDGIYSKVITPRDTDTNMLSFKFETFSTLEEGHPGWDAEVSILYINDRGLRLDSTRHTSEGHSSKCAHGLSHAFEELCNGYSCGINATRVSSRATFFQPHYPQTHDFCRSSGSTTASARST